MSVRFEGYAALFDRGDRQTPPSSSKANAGWAAPFTLSGRGLQPRLNRLRRVNPPSGRLGRHGCRFRILKSSVPMVQAAKDRTCNNVSNPLDQARVGGVLPE